MSIATVVPSFAIVSDVSHLDHGLSKEHIDWLKERFADRSGFFIETVEIPKHLAPVKCGLVGPATGFPAVAEDKVTYKIRGKRKCSSRLIKGELFETRQLTVIAGPEKVKDVEYKCVLYTTYGGPQSPREPGDTTIPIEQVLEARKFWSEHALIDELETTRVRGS